MSQLQEAGLRPFNGSGYEILDQDLASRGVVVIWSVDPLAPRLGDLYTLERKGRVYEVAVREIATFKGGWSATCRTVGAL